MLRRIAALALAALIPACGGGSSGDGGGAYAPFVVYLADAETDEVLELYAADAAGQTRKLSGPLVAGGRVESFIWSPDRSRVAFLADKDVDGLRQLYVVEPDGDALARVSPSGEVASLPQWSPDGSRLAFFSAAAPSAPVELHAWSSSGLVSVARAASSVATFAWSPDGGRLAFQGDFGSGSGLYTARADGTERTLAASPAGRFGWAGAERLVFEAAGNPGWALFSVAPGGGTPVRLSGTQAFAWSIPFAPSPDGALIAYASFEDNQNGQEIYTVRSDGGGRVRVSPGAGGNADALSPRWSPDGTGLVMHAQGAVGPFVLWSCGPAGEHGVSLGSVWNASWSPDGARLAVQSDELTSGVGELFVVRPDGSGRIRVSGPMVSGGDVHWSAVNHFPVPHRWSPDGARLAYLADQETDGVVELYCVGADGSALVKVSGSLVAGGDVGVRDYPFQWASDGASLVYQADQDVDDLFELYRASPDGAKPVKLSGTLPSFADSAAFTVR